MKKLIFRLYQKIMYLLSFFISFEEPLLIHERGGLKKVPDILLDKEIKNVMLVTDEYLGSTDLFKSLVTNLQSNGLDTSIYDQTKPNPSLTSIKEAYKLYKENNCQALIAYGGGSVMDLAKGVGAKVARPNKPISKMRGTLKIRKKIPFLICVPSTVGTGSEATLAAVVSDKEKHEKYAIMDPVLMPDVAILDIEIVKTLPKKMIAQTGMDALTHALEAYIGKANTRKTKDKALNAIKIIFEDLEKAYSGNIDSLEKMQVAAYDAGVAFTRAYVGNVHALAHQMSAVYDMAHGYSNAVILPHVLDYYGQKIEQPLVEVYDYVYGESKLDAKEKRMKIIENIRRLKKALDIEVGFDGLIKESDLSRMVDNAYKEANPLYPVPVIFDKSDFRKLYVLINES
jgi:alcohol dehydrogenase class IV